MSSHSNIDLCPKCEEKTLKTYFETRPYDQANGYCLNCGFKYETVEGKLTEEELGELRKEECYNPKTKKFE